MTKRRLGGASRQRGISKACDNPAGAWQFIEYMMQPEQVALMSNTTGLVPTTPSAAALTENYAEGGKYRVFFEIAQRFAVLLVACSGQAPRGGATPPPTQGKDMIQNMRQAPTTPGPLSDEPYRPRYHFSAPAGWLNDPNGLIYLEGEYHLFYQHYPDAIVWGPMHWGHAVSRDLRTWEQLPIALAPDEHGMIFSGSAVLDHANTAGFGAGAMVAVFTQDQRGRQAQSLAHSVDRGRTWTKYAGNPVLPPPPGTPDFRDPRVFWYDQGGAGHWVMLLAAGRSIWIYRSPDLKTWTKTDVVGGRGASGGVWECPDLVELPVGGGPETRWVLIVSVQQGAPAGGSGQQYFVGDFNGERFTPTEGPGVVRWADYGADFYAAQSWGGEAPGGRRLWLAWMNNWGYAQQTPATTWRGTMTFPREISLARGTDGLQLIQQPVAELAALRQSFGSWDERTVLPGENPLAELRGDSFELVARFAVNASTAASRFGLRVRVGAGEQTTVAYNMAKGVLYVDRSRSGQSVPGFATPQVLALSPREGLVELRLLVDRSSLEVFADGGRVVFTNQIFPSPDSQGAELFAEGGAVQLMSLEAYRLARQ